LEEGIGEGVKGIRQDGKRKKMRYKGRRSLEEWDVTHREVFVEWDEKAENISERSEVMGGFDVDHFRFKLCQ
jgi:hypothetical protein